MLMTVSAFNDDLSVIYCKNEKADKAAHESRLSCKGY